LANVLIDSSDATIEAIRVRGPQGDGIVAQALADATYRGSTTVRASIVENTVGGGIVVNRSDATVDSTLMWASASSVRISR
jgi:hypothetical protein